jgi:hypothetical protein
MINELFIVKRCAESQSENFARRLVRFYNSQILYRTEYKKKKKKELKTKKQKKKNTQLASPHQRCWNETIWIDIYIDPPCLSLSLSLVCIALEAFIHLKSIFGLPS